MKALVLAVLFQLRGGFDEEVQKHYFKYVEVGTSDPINAQSDENKLYIEEGKIKLKELILAAPKHIPLLKCVKTFKSD